MFTKNQLFKSECTSYERFLDLAGQFSSFVLLVLGRWMNIIIFHKCSVICCFGTLFFFLFRLFFSRLQNPPSRFFAILFVCLCILFSFLFVFWRWFTVTILLLCNSSYFFFLLLWCCRREFGSQARTTHSPYKTQLRRERANEKHKNGHRFWNNRENLFCRPIHAHAAFVFV